MGNPNGFSDDYFRRMFESPQYRDYQQRNPNAYVPPTENVSTNIPPFPSTGGNTRGRAPPGNQQGESMAQQAHGTHQMTPNAHGDYRDGNLRMPSSNSNQAYYPETHSSQSSHGGYHGETSNTPSSSNNQGYYTEANSSQSHPPMGGQSGTVTTLNLSIPAVPRSMNIISGEMSGGRPQAGELVMIEGGHVGKSRSGKTSRRGTRRQLYQKKGKAIEDQAHDRGGDVLEDDNTFEFILLKEHKPSQAPIDTEVISYPGIGLGKKIIEISVDDTVIDVTKSIKAAYPILTKFKGGVEMSVKNKQGKSRSINSFDTPILSGMQVHETGKKVIYLSRLIDHPFPPAIKSSGCREICPSCDKMIDVNIMKFHHEQCVLELETSASSASETEVTDTSSKPKKSVEQVDLSEDTKENEEPGCRLPPFQLPESLPYPGEDVFARGLEQLEAQKTKLCDDVESANPNRYEFDRSDPGTSAHEAAQNDDFMRLVRNPLFATLKDDTEEVTRHVLSILMTIYDLSIQDQHRHFMDNRRNVRNREFYGHELFAMGVFAGIAITQLGMFPFFVRRWMEFLMEVEVEHPFLVGLDKFGIVELARKERDFIALFIPIPFQFRIIRPMLTLNPRDLEDVSDVNEKKMIGIQEQLCFQLFVEFVREVSDGLVNVASGPMTLKEIFQFVTGCYQIPRQEDCVKISIGFVTSSDAAPTFKSPDDATPFYKVEMPLVDSIETMKSKWISAFNTEGLSFHRR